MSQGGNPGIDPALEGGHSGEQWLGVPVLQGDPWRRQFDFDSAGEYG